MTNSIDWQGELGQDRFVIDTLGGKTHGYFVEFGAMDGRQYSNTWVLEKHYNWQGIVSEPNPRFHEGLAAHRSCVVDNRAVWSKSNQLLDFVCRHHGYSGLAETGKEYTEQVISVASVTLNDLLDAHAAPATVDYVSMDTEGSELSILQSFDWSRRRVLIWTIEHNYHAENRANIRQIMEGHGYRWARPNQTQYDDWYVHQDLGEQQ